MAEAYANLGRLAFDEDLRPDGQTVFCELEDDEFEGAVRLFSAIRSSLRELKRQARLNLELRCSEAARDVQSLSGLEGLLKVKKSKKPKVS